MSTVKKVFAKLKEVLRGSFGHSRDGESTKSKGKKPARNTSSVSFSEFSSTARTGRSTNNIAMRSIHTRQATPGPSSSRRKRSGSTLSPDYPLYGVPGGIYDPIFFDSSTTYGGGFDAGTTFDGGACDPGGGDAGGSCGCD